MTDADRLPTGPVLRRFWPTIVHRDLKPENILPGQYAFEAFLAVRGRLGGASFCELECEIIPGAVREVVSVAKVQRKPRAKLQRSIGNLDVGQLYATIARYGTGFSCTSPNMGKTEARVKTATWVTVVIRNELAKVAA